MNRATRDAHLRLWNVSGWRTHSFGLTPERLRSAMERLRASEVVENQNHRTYPGWDNHGARRTITVDWGIPRFEGVGDDRIICIAPDDIPWSCYDDMRRAADVAEELYFRLKRRITTEELRAEVLARALADKL